MDYENFEISPELREKAKACTSPEELLELAKREGYKLSDDEMDAVSGGFDWSQRCDNFSCNNQRMGDTRTDINPARAHDDFVNGAVDGGELD